MKCLFLHLNFQLPTPPSCTNALVTPPAKLFNEMDHPYLVFPDFVMDIAEVPGEVPTSPGPTPDHYGQSLSSPVSPVTAPLQAPPTAKQKIPRHKRDYHIKAEYRRLSRIQVSIVIFYTSQIDFASNYYCCNNYVDKEMCVCARLLSVTSLYFTPKLFTNSKNK